MIIVKIQFNLRVKTVNKGTKQKRRDFHKGDYDGMRKYAQNNKWKLLLKNKKPTQCWKMLKQEFDYMINTFVPFKRQKVNEETAVVEIVQNYWE